MIKSMKIMGEFYKYSARNPKITARALVGKATKSDMRKFREWMRGIAKKYDVPYSEVSSFFGERPKL